ncbi:MAG: hypothetical protein ACE5FC_02680 [Myxococcota bacterium]
MYPRTVAAFGLALALVFAPALPALASGGGAGTIQPQSTWKQAGLGILSIASNVLYAPAKIIYGGLGLATGSMGWLLTGGDSEVSSRVFTPSLRGTYVLTPRHLTGDDPIHFVGTSGYNSTGPRVAQPAPASPPNDLVASGDPLAEESF